MYVYIVSDIHLECQNDDFNLSSVLIKPDHTNSILVCCGDICTLYKIDKIYRFFDYACSIFKYVIYVPGNCEYYKPTDTKKSITFSMLNQTLDSLSDRYNNLHILNNESIQVNDFLITGSILWSHIKYDLPHHFKISGFSKEIYNRKNKTCINFIKKQIQYAKQTKYKHLIITHYPPSKECLLNTNPDKKDKYKTMYYNNLDGLFDNNLTWIYGHCHNNKNFKISNTQLVSNQYGKNNFFDSNFSNNYFILI
tara:strand:+ start:1171 stop:1926 length:756 start_codon:yes stop_codon:yes gene_type:complete